MGCGASSKKGYAKPLPPSGEPDPQSIASPAPSEPPPSLPAPPLLASTADGGSDKLVVHVPATQIPASGTVDEELRRCQMTAIASGTAAREGTSIKLDPHFAECLRRRVQLMAERVGGPDKMFALCDVDGNLSLDVNEFMKLMERLPTKRAEYRRNDEHHFAVKDNKGHEVLIKKLDKGGSEKVQYNMTSEGLNLPSSANVIEGRVEKPLTKREATALFWHLDEDESDMIEPDEFTAWLQSGQRKNCSSYRNRKK